MSAETPEAVARFIRPKPVRSDRAVSQVNAHGSFPGTSLKAHAWPSRKPLPPYGRQWIEAGAKYGPFVICGPGAWDMAQRRKHCGFAMVAPSDRDPLDFDWSLLKGRMTVLIEAGGFDTPRLERVAFALLVAGVPLVHPIRTVCLDMDPPQTWPSYTRDDYVADAA